jgi:DNA invertase Pin-like site-specific DNA recombinase
MERLIGYIRVSTPDQLLSIDAQKMEIERYCEYHNKELVRIDVEVATGTSTEKRPLYLQMVSDCELAIADGILSTKLDRIARSNSDFAELLARATEGKFNIIVPEINLDMKNPMGEFIVSVFMAVAQLEVKLLKARTRAALAVLKSKDIKLGPSYSISPEVLDIIVAYKQQGLSTRVIASRLNEDNIKAPRSNRWNHNTIARVIKTMADRIHDQNRPLYLGKAKRAALVAQGTLPTTR